MEQAGKAGGANQRTGGQAREIGWETGGMHGEKRAGTQAGEISRDTDGKAGLKLQDRNSIIGQCIKASQKYLYIYMYGPLVLKRNGSCAARRSDCAEEG